MCNFKLAAIRMHVHDVDQLGKHAIELGENIYRRPLNLNELQKGFFKSKIPLEILLDLKATLTK